MKPSNEKTTFTFRDGSTVLDRFLALSGRGNKPFTRSLHPGIDNILGLRVPDLRSLAREIAHDDYEAYLAMHGTHYMEERMLHGMVLGVIPTGECNTYLRRVARFVGEINSWSVCDTFDFSGKGSFVAKHSKEVREFLLGYVDSEKEYEVRFAVVMLMAHFLGPDSWRATVDVYEQITHNGYYVKMAVAWALSVAYVRYPEDVRRRLSRSKFDNDTLRMAVRKIRESRRISADDKGLALQLLVSNANVRE